MRRKVTMATRAPVALLLVLLALVETPAPAGAGTLETVRTRGTLVCGVGPDLPGFSTVDAKGRWSGLDVDFCHAVAAAVLRDRTKVQFRPLTDAERFTALTGGMVDVLLRASAWTMSRDVGNGVVFVGALFHDGRAFMVPKSQGVLSTLELSGARLCSEPGNGLKVIGEYFRARKMRVEVAPCDRLEECLKAYQTKQCTVLSADLSSLAGQRMKLADPAAHTILPEQASIEPLGPAVRTGDERWFALLRGTIFALISAEEFGLSSTTPDAPPAQIQSLELRRLLGLDGNLAEPLGLDAAWAQRIVRQVGNYGELFERNLGARSPLKLGRGLNKLWTRGGLMFAPPLR